MLILWMFSQPFLLLPLWTRSVLNSRLLPRRSENYSQSIQTSSSPIDFVKYTIFKIWGHMKRELYEKYTFTKFKITTFSWNTLPDFEICKFIVLLNSFDTCLPILNIVFFFISRLTSFLEICKHLFFFSMPQLPSFQIFRQVLKFEKIKFLSHWLTTFFWHLSPNFNIVFVLSHWLTSFCRLKTPFLEIL